MNRETAKVLFSAESQEWYTPLDFYRKLDDEFHFDIDPCADPTNRLGCKIFYTQADDGLAKEWPKGNIFCNPPYGVRGKVHLWVAKCVEHAKSGKGVAVLLIAARIDTAWFHGYIWQKPNVELRVLRGRLKFLPSPGSQKHKNSATFPSLVAIFRPPPSPSPANTTYRIHSTIEPYPQRRSVSLDDFCDGITII
jgi:site-specific DNA-methyltransferase (adenine-specific)